MDQKNSILHFARLLKRLKTRRRWCSNADHVGLATANNNNWYNPQEITRNTSLNSYCQEYTLVELLVYHIAEANMARASKPRLCGYLTIHIVLQSFQA